MQLKYFNILVGGDDLCVLAAHFLSSNLPIMYFKQKKIDQRKCYLINNYWYHTINTVKNAVILIPLMKYYIYSHESLGKCVKLR